MPKENADQPNRRSFLKILFDRRWKKVTAGIAILIVATLILIPYGIRYSVKRLILANGGDDAHIEDVDFNPFTGRVALTGLNIKVDQKQYLKISDAEVLLRWWPLLKKRIGVKKVWLNDTDMIIESLPEGKFRLGGITAVLLKGSQEGKQPSSWEFGAKEVTIENTKVHLRMPDFETTVHVNKWAIRRAFSWQPEETANIDIDGKINDSPVKISGEVTPFATDRRAKGKFKIEDLKLGPFSNLLKNAATQISGTVSVDADLNMTQKEDGSFAVDHDGAIRVENLDLKTADFKTTASDISYNGTAAASIPSNGDLTLQIDGSMAGNKLGMSQSGPALTALLASLEWKGPVNFTQTATVRKVDADGQLIAAGLTAEAGGGKFEEDQLSWKGTLAATVEASAKKVQAVLEGELGSQKLTATLAETNLTLAQSGFNWSGKAEALQTAESTGINLDGNLTIQAVRAESKTFNTQHEVFNWNGRANLVLPGESAGLAVRTDGQFAGGRFGFKMPAEEIKSGHESIEWKGNIDYVVNEMGPRIDTDGSLNLQALEFDSPGVVAAEERIDWVGKWAVALPQEDKKLALLLDGKANFGKLNVRLPTHRLMIGQDSFSWDGPLAYGQQAQTGEQVSGGATAKIDNLRITDDGDRHLIAGAGNVSAEAVQMIGSNGLRGSTLRISALQFLMPQQAKASPLLGAESITLQAFELDPENKIEIKAIVIDALQSKLRRKSDGQWSFSESLAALQSAPAEKPTRPDTKKDNEKNEAPRYSIGKLIIRGNSQIEFEDNTVAPAVSRKMALNAFELSSVDSSRPGDESPFKLEGKIGKYTEIDFAGFLKPFDERLSMDLKGNIADLELPPLSPYIANAIGYNFSSGQADADLKIAIDRGQMNGKTKFRFDQLRAKPVDKETLKKRGIEQTIPMETALSLLRDKDGTIKLKVPITGDIADPKFSVGDAINQALVKATAKASMAYLKYALGPYGIAIAAAEVAYMAATYAGGIRLEPVKFVAGTADIDPADQDYVEKLATILKDRPEAKIRVCGLAAQALDQAAILASGAKAESTTGSSRSGKKEPTADGAAAPDKAEEESFGSKAAAPGSAAAQLPPEQLEALAEARSMAVKDFLVDQHGIKDDRILLCHPEIDKTAAGKPRAEILF